MNCCNAWGHCTHGPGCPAGPAPAANPFPQPDPDGRAPRPLKPAPACPCCSKRLANPFPQPASAAQAQADEPLTSVEDVLQSVALVMLLALSVAVLGVASGIVWALHGSEIRELVWSAITTLSQP